MAPPTLDRIKESFARELESLGVVSLDQWRHKALKEAVERLVEQVAAEVGPAPLPSAPDLDAVAEEQKIAEAASESEPVAADPSEAGSSSSETAQSPVEEVPASDGSSDPQPTESEQTNG